MTISVVGISHRTAPLDVRERFAIDREASADVLRRLAADGGAEAVVLSTCNRTELYLHARTDAADPTATAAAVLHAHAGVEPGGAASYLYTLCGEGAVRHLFRVVSSLDSMVLGEAQIQGQVREAYGNALAVSAGRAVVGPVLSRLFDTALRVGARVRSETKLGAGAASIPSAAVELAVSVFGSLENRTAVVLGTGEMSRLALRCLNARGARCVIVSSRSDARASALATEFGGGAAKMEELPSLLRRTDVVASATAAPHTVIGRPLVEAALDGGREHPLLILDIALPRDVDPAVGELDGVLLYDLDDLSGVIEGTLQERQSEIALAEQIIECGVDEFLGWYRARGAVPVIRELRDRAEALRRRELDRARGALRELTPEQLSAVDALTRQLLAKLLHAPTARLREAAMQGQDANLTETVRYLFSLDDDSDEAE